MLCSFLLFAVLWHYKELYENEKIKSDNYSILLENERLDVKSDSLINANKELDEKIVIYQERIDSFEYVVRNKNKKISELKKHENEALHSIDSLDSSELIKLFSITSTR